MQKQRESYEQMQAVLKEFLDACRKTAPWITDIQTLAGAARIMSGTASCQAESAALAEMWSRLNTLAGLQVKVQGVLSNLPNHPHWPCEDCPRWGALGCNRKSEEGGFWG